MILVAIIFFHFLFRFSVYTYTIQQNFCFVNNLFQIF
nr:MAG TPA: hypothetical protein [Bacteriophage sp.]